MKKITPIHLVLALVLFLAGLVSANAQTSGTRFAVIGDYGSAGQSERDVANLVKSWSPDFIITTGDNNYPSGAASTIDQNVGQYYHDYISPYFGSYGAGASLNRFFPSLGNHDWYTTGAQPYLNYFTLPNNERYYEFISGPVHLFAVDSDPSEPDGTTRNSVQAAWLQNRLAAAPEPWKLVYFHHAPYSSGSEHGSSSWMQWPFQSWGASTVLSGHDHDYERILVGGFPYFVNGLGGVSRYAFGSPVAGSQVRYNGDYGAMLVTATTEDITFQFVTRGGTVIDTYTLSKGPGVTVPPAPSALTAAVNPATQINLAWQDNSNNEESFVIERSIDGVNFAPVTSVGANVTTYSDSGLSNSTTYFYRVLAHNAAGYSGYSNTASATTGIGNVPPEAPTDLSATAVSRSQINLVWADNATDEDGFAIERSADGRRFSQIDVVGADTTGYFDTGLRANRTYYYRVRAFNAEAGYSDYSNIAGARTPHK